MKYIEMIRTFAEHKFNAGSDKKQNKKTTNIKVRKQSLSILNLHLAAL